MPAAAPALRYRIAVADLNAHLYEVTLSIDRPAADQVVSLPVWIPGSYLVREFARNLEGAPKATQGRRNVVVTQLDKASWRIAAKAGQPLVVRYVVCAFDNSVRTAWLDRFRGFFNGTSLCLRVEGQDDAPCHIEIVPPVLPEGDAPWELATALRPVKTDRRGFGTYQAADYDEVADSPVEMGAFWSAEFDVLGVPHRFVVAGAPPSFDGDKLIADTRAICETQMRFWHKDDPGLPPLPAGEKPGEGPTAAAKAKRSPKARATARHPAPHDRYVFMLNATDDGYGGLEHRHSTALICTRRDLPRRGTAKQPEGYTTLLGLISHEYFHTWNVKRLRPAEFARYDYTRENYTRLLWFFEGFTSYYDDLLLRRAGCIDDATYLKLLNKTINQVQQTPGAAVQSVADASFDAWIRYYRPDEQTPNMTVSYYTKGALVALCLDLTLRRERKGSLDEVMRELWRASEGGPIDEAAIATALEAIGGRGYASELRQWAQGTAELPLRELLAAHGVAVHDDPAQLAQALGLRVDDSGGTVKVKMVLRGGAAEKAGFAAGDEWLGVEAAARNAKAAEGWRIGKLDDIALYVGDAKKCIALVARDRHLLRITLTLPGSARTWRLGTADANGIREWLKRA
ncbi:M61 family metallopeptidase [Pseudacidovorax intermedius]|uniref:Peptidase M61 n=1 Tax=Pseudacidovorax intermedius TaxID=433924 RepID=A0A147H7X7_9BURK|nr:M61 family metallopeptidase [Pseudacidovorax intermedius]KTT25809.1 peptidase M61 [Pseudacidovorax intermedius]